MEYVIPAALGLIGVVVGALIQSASQRAKIKAEVRKADAESTEFIRQTCMGLIEPLQGRIDELEVELKDWMDCAERRAEQLRARDLVPAPFKSSNKRRYGDRA